MEVVLCGTVVIELQTEIAPYVGDWSTLAHPLTDGWNEHVPTLHRIENLAIDSRLHPCRPTRMHDMKRNSMPGLPSLRLGYTYTHA